MFASSIFSLCERLYSSSVTVNKLWVAKSCAPYRKLHDLELTYENNETPRYVPSLTVAARVHVFNVKIVSKHLAPSSSLLGLTVLINKQTKKQKKKQKTKKQKTNKQTNTYDVGKVERLLQRKARAPLWCSTSHPAVLRSQPYNKTRMLRLWPCCAVHFSRMLQVRSAPRNMNIEKKMHTHAFWNVKEFNVVKIRRTTPFGRYRWSSFDNTAARIVV